MSCLCHVTISLAPCFSTLFLVCPPYFTLVLFVSGSESAFLRHISFYLFGNISLTLTSASEADKLGPKRRRWVVLRRADASHAVTTQISHLRRKGISIPRTSHIPHPFMTFTFMTAVWCVCAVFPLFCFSIFSAQLKY